ncbi:MAG: ferredoxin [Methanomassiliicoccales archaeon]
MTLKVFVDQEECSQCGLCYEDECPEVFEEDDGLCRIVEEYRTSEPIEGEVPDSLKDCVKNAAEQCPTDAIEVVES